ncbi:MAG: threonine--tRNA ligase, partial [bacterium]
MPSKQIDLETKRHSLAHLMAAAVQSLYPQAKFGIGPVIDNGFYYDFDLATSLAPEDLQKIEREMRRLIKEDLPFDRQEMKIEEAIKLFKKLKQDYKVELLNDLQKKGTTKMDSEESADLGLSGKTKAVVYQTGNFTDLCRGPHVKSAKELSGVAFKLVSLAGAYWRGSEKNKMLQRIYSVAFADQQELTDHLHNLAEAEKRDHRKLGRELDLFHLDETVGAGLPLWHPHGALLWRLIEDFWYKKHLENGYDLVRTPHIGKRILWETSGHWGFYNNSMYPPMEVGQSLGERQQNQKVKNSEEFILKPMNCPFHVQIYKDSLRSYRELPLRWAECGTVYRFEKKGELTGLIRVRGFTQDDAHIICRKSQVGEELKRVIDFILFIYQS